MNPDVKQKWLAALRSRKYKQAKGALRHDGGYCCLGVLCDLHAEEHGDFWEIESYHGQEGLLPEIVMSWAGLPSTGGAAIEIDDRNMDLAEHNDLGETFDALADAIESQL